MSVKTKMLAIHSIQKNMLASYTEGNKTNILLATGMLMVITTPNPKNAEWVFTTINAYPSESGNKVGDNNSKFTDFEMTIELQKHY